jgi:hypothetical protein
MKDIEQYLRENKPVVKEDPTFLLETRHRLEAVEGIKGEVDRQSCRMRKALILALVFGLIVGVGVATLAYFFPVNPETVGDGLLDSARLFLQNYRSYLFLPIALLAIALGLVMTRKKGTAFI